MLRLGRESLLHKLSGYNIPNLQDVLDYVDKNFLAFTSLKKPMTDLSIYVIIKNTGDAVFFKTIRGFVVKDKLDIAYVNSRELIGLEIWNVNTVMHITKCDESNYGLKFIGYSEILSVLFNTVTPDIADYAVVVNNKCYPLHLDADMLDDVDYMTLRGIVSDFIEHKLKHTVQDFPNCILVDYDSNVA